MSKWRFTPLLVVVAAALTAFASEGALVSEIAKVVGLVALVLFLFLFATRHRSGYRTGGEEKRTQRSALGVAILALVLGCSSMPQRPAEFLMPSNEFTWERGERMRASGATMEAQGQRLEKEAERLRSQAADLERQGRSLIDSSTRMRADADVLASEGVALRERGREAADLGNDAIEAARKLEESERLRREAEEQRERSRL